MGKKHGGFSKQWGQNYGVTRRFCSWMCIWKKQTPIWKKGYMHPGVHSSTIHNSRDTEAPQVSQHQWMDKHMRCTCGGILRSHQKEWDNAICSNMEGIMLSEIRKRRRNTVKSWEIPQSSERNKKEAGSKKQRTHWWSLVGVGSARCRTGSKMNPTARGTQPVFYDN